ncbi:MAG: hypothetical protein ABIE55_04155 [Candidatus Aenigmatarchaeota archaeon]
MKESIKKSIISDSNDGWKSSVRKVYLYTIYFIIVYALWIGFKMAEMLSAGEEIPSFLKVAHVHTLCISFLLLFLLYDLRIKDRVEKLNIKWGLGEIIIGIGLSGHFLTTGGFSLAGLNPSMTGSVMPFVGIGESLILYSVLSYAIAGALTEMYK